MTKTKPAKNRAGWASGTIADLWSINPVTGQFDDVGDMQVSADGTQIVVPVRAPVSAPGPAAPGVPAGPVHLNTATLEQLDALPGVGPVTAQKILDYRQQHGAFGSVEELDAIPGIGPARLAQLQGLVAP